MIKILTWVEPTQSIIEKIKEKHPQKFLEIVKKSHLKSSLIHFMKQQQANSIDEIFLFYSNINIPFNWAYLQGLCLFCRVKKKTLIDLNGVEKKVSKISFIFKGIPIIIWGSLISFITLVLSYMTIILLLRSFIFQLFNKYSKRKEKLTNIYKKKRILYLWSEFPDSNFDCQVGGQISHIIGFISGLKRLACDTCLVSSTPIWHKNFNSLNKVIEMKNFPPWPGEIKEIAYNWIVLSKMNRLIQEWNPSLLYHRTSAFSFIGVLLCIVYRIPLIIEVNSSEKWKAKNWSQSRFHKIIILTEHLNLQYADKIAVVSEIVRNYLTKEGISYQKITVNPNGVDPTFFRPLKDTKKVVEKYRLDNNIIIGFIGTFNNFHGVLTLAKSVRLVVQENDRVHFLIIGDGKLRKDFENIICSDRMITHVTMTGKIPHESVPSLLSACDILVSPHHDMEDGSVFFGSPMKIFEYMATGKGIVASHVGQLGKILTHEETALLVEPENPEALAKNIIRLTQDNALRQKLGENARKHVIEHYTWEQNVLRILEPMINERAKAK